MKSGKQKSYFRRELLGRGVVTFCGILIVVITLAIIVFISGRGLQSFFVDGISPVEILASSVWDPGGQDPAFGALIFIAGSALTAIGAVLISAPLAIMLAIFINFIAPTFGNKVLKPALELFVGIPSVVYGLLGVTVLLPILKGAFGGIGFSLLAAIIVLSVMILPTITTIASDAFAALPSDYLEASYGLGSTRWQAIWRVLLPGAKKGILTGIVLGLARGVGEALAVQMVIGNALRFPSGFMDPTITLTGILAMDMTTTVQGTPWNNVLWTLAMVLLLISFVFIFIIRVIGSRGEK